MSLSLNNSLSEQGLARPFIVDVFFGALDLFVKKSLLVSVFLSRSIFLPKFERGSDIFELNTYLWYIVFLLCFFCGEKKS
jgi:hypothetical protein